MDEFKMVMSVGFDNLKLFWQFLPLVTISPFFFILRSGVRAASNSAYSGYPDLWILRYPAHRYHAVPSPGFEPTTLWLRVRQPNHYATMLHHQSF
jgi:hypothetical protein